MHLKPPYPVRFWYPGDWAVEMAGKAGKEEQHFFFTDGTCTGALNGRFLARTTRAVGPT